MGSARAGAGRKSMPWDCRGNSRPGILYVSINNVNKLWVEIYNYK